MSISTPARHPRGAPASQGGRFAPSGRAESDDAALSPPACPGPAFPGTGEAFTRRYDTLDEKVAAFKAELDDAVARLADDDHWQRYLETMSRKCVANA